MSAGLQAASPTGVAPFSEAFTASVAGGIAPFEMTWHFGDGAVLIAAANVTHTYLAPGTYTATVQVNDSLGYSATASVVVDVVPAPSVALSSSLARMDVGQNTTLTAAPSGLTPPITFVWSGLPPRCLPANDSVLVCGPQVAGNYSIRVQAIMTAGVRADAVGSILVLPRVTASVSAPAASCTCACTAGVSETLSASVTGGEAPYSYAWSLGDGATSAAASPVHAYVAGPAAIVRNITLTVTDSLGESAVGRATFVVPPTTCSGPPGGSSVSTLFVALFVAIGVLAIAVLVLFVRGRPPRGEPPSVDDPPAADPADPAEPEDAPFESLAHFGAGSVTGEGRA